MTARDIVMSSAGNAGDSKTYIEDVFSTYLYTGNGSTQTINNGIDLAGKGGMVWTKNRTTTDTWNHMYDTQRGPGNILFSNATSSNQYNSQTLVSFNNSGFTVGSNAGSNNSGSSYASWTFRKAPKFFDVVTYTGNGASTQTINHALTVTPGMVIIKRTDSTSDWVVLHNEGWLKLNTTGAVNAGGWAWNSTSLTVYSSSGYGVNTSGASYVAYFFAHDTTTDGLIQCGSFSGATTVDVNLGWEPQYVLFKNASSGGSWFIADVMRGMSNTRMYPLQANTSDAEFDLGGAGIIPTATGFTFKGANFGYTSGQDIIYMAIRRGPMRTPTDGTKVFKPSAVTGYSGYLVNSGFPVDLTINRVRNNTIESFWTIDRLRGSNNPLFTDTTDAEASLPNRFLLDSNLGVVAGDPYPWNSVSAAFWNFRRAPGFFDVVCFKSTGSSQAVNHNLGVAPELIITKPRDTTGNWNVGALFDSSGFKYQVLNNSNASYSADYSGGFLYSGQPTSTTFNYQVAGGYNFVSYLFASCPGVSKVGSYTGNGSSQTINCGFTNGARFVLIKRTDSTGDWYVWDTARGIVAGTDPHLSLNTTAAEVTTDDTIDPASTGFIVNQDAATNVNVSGASYIFLAIA